MKKNILKIYFIDFWTHFNKNDNYFFHLLSKKYNVVVTDNNPDILFISSFHRPSDNIDDIKYKNSKKIFYTGEDQYPEDRIYDATFTFKKTLGNNYRLPLWVLHLNWFNVPLKKSRDISYHGNIENLLTKENKFKKNKFCSFVSSKETLERVEFVRGLSKYKSIDSPGDVLNNHKKLKGRGDQKYKLNFLKKYIFNISFENTNSHGYVTEKIIQPMFVNTLPIYWGTNEVKNDFNPKSFVYVNDFENYENAINHIKNIYEDKHLYKEILSQPWFHENKIPDRFLPTNILGFLEDIL
jgi:hypothetical protein